MSVYPGAFRGISKSSLTVAPYRSFPSPVTALAGTTALGLSRGLRTRPIKNRPRTPRWGQGRTQTRSYVFDICRTSSTSSLTTCAFVSQHGSRTRRTPSCPSAETGCRRSRRWGNPLEPWRLRSCNLSSLDLGCRWCSVCRAMRLGRPWPARNPCPEGSQRSPGSRLSSRVRVPGSWTVRGCPAVTDGLDAGGAAPYRCAARPPPGNAAALW